MSGVIVPYKGRRPKVDGTAYVAPTAVLIGNVEVGAESSIWFNCVLRGDEHEIRVGDRTNIQDGTVIHLAEFRRGTYIGSDVTIGHRALLHACTLEDWCFIGMGAIVMDDAVVESRAMVAAGALVTPGKRIRSGELWAGSPAKCLRQVRPDEYEEFERIANGYCELGRNFRREGEKAVT